MKSNLISKLIFLLIFYINISFSYSEELKFEAKSIEIIDKDKIIIANEGVKILSGNETVIDADQMRYDKEKKFLEASGNILITNQLENIEITSDNITYDKNAEKIVSSGNVEIKIEENYSLKTKEIIYLKNSEEILINDISKIKDTFGNEIEFGQLNYNAIEKLIKGKKVKLLDLENNFYNFDNAIVDFSKNQIIADNVNISFNKNIFGNQLNDPRLKGNYFLCGKISIIKKEFLHLAKKTMIVLHGRLKQKKLNTIRKRLSIIKMRGLKYTISQYYISLNFSCKPNCKKTIRFFDASSYNSSSLGLSFKLPYYKVISENKDFTFSPRIFRKRSIVQNEYRQVNKNHLMDFSLKRKTSTSKTHFFSNSIAKLDMDIFDISEVEMNLETTSDDKYLKTHNIKSAININQSLLNSFLIFRGSSRDMNFETKFEAYEDLTNDISSDKYEYIFPITNFPKELSQIAMVIMKLSQKVIIKL